MEKLKVGFISNSPLIKTGLARNIKALLPILYKTNKYEIFMLNQSMSDSEPNFQRFPWKNEGCMKNFDQQRFNSDPQYQREVAYCNTAIEDWITRNRLDVVLAFDDPWFFNLSHLKSDWYNFIKENFLFNITLDSLPVLPHAKELAKNCPNFRVWSGFAERELKKEDSNLYGHVKTLRGAIDIEQFIILPKQERLNLRHKFGISDDEKIIIFLGRNQLRKSGLASNQEALAIWKKKYPDRKIRLLFHTKYNEPNGWPIEQIREELKLNKEDILCTYFCRNCQDWNLQSYQGEDIGCHHCKSQKSKVTAGIDSTINEHDLNKIYNISDASCSPFTSGGQEYTLIESMLAGLPLACPNYSCGEDPILSGFVREIKGSYYREFNTSFKKFNPDINSIVDFYDYIWNLKEEDRDILVKNAREWAIKEFDSNNISRQIEEWLDTRKPIDWNSYFNRKKELKDLNAQLTQEEFNLPDSDFIKCAYNKLLKMDVNEQDEGYNHWARFLAQPKDKNQLRNELIQHFKVAAHQHNQKVQPQIPFESLLDSTDKERVLLCLKESIGDHYLLTALLPEIQLKYANASIYIGCEEKFFEIYENNKFVKKCLKWIPEFDNELWVTGQVTHKGYFNYYHLVGIATQHKLNYLNSKYE